MLRSMYSGISGLKNFQTKLDVIGNNIANVNTYGFKKGRTIFKDLISQTVAGASAPGDTRGGVNAKQVGLGSQIAAIDTIHTGGSTQFTGNTLDVAISGDGFFQVMDGTETFYTRAGNFYMDNTGDLVDGDGRYIRGMGVAKQAVKAVAAVTADPNATPPVVAAAGVAGSPVEYNKTASKLNIPITASSMSVGQDGTVFYVDAPKGAAKAIEDAEIEFKGAEKTYNDAVAAVVPPVVLAPAVTTAYEAAKTKLAKVKEENAAVLQVAGKIQIATFSNAGGLEKTGGNLFRVSANSGNPNVGHALEQGFGTIQSGFLEMSNVDLSEEFTEMIVAQRGFQANTRIITTSDEILQELVNLKR